MGMTTDDRLDVLKTCLGQQLGHVRWRKIKQMIGRVIQVQMARPWS